MIYVLPEKLSTLDARSRQDDALIAWCPMSVSRVEILTTELAAAAHDAHRSGGH